MNIKLISERSESQSFSPHEFSCNDETMENNDTRKSILPTIVARLVEQKLEHRSLFLNLALFLVPLAIVPVLQFPRRKGRS